MLKGGRKFKIKFIYQGSRDGICYFKCKICKDIFNENEFIEHQITECEKPLAKNNIIKILKETLQKSIKNGYKIPNN